MPVVDPVQLLLAGRYPDPETGEHLAAESRSVVIEDSLAGHEAELVGALGLGKRFVVIADRNTFDVLGQRVTAALGATPIVLDEPHADSDTVARLVAAIAPGTDAIVAVGSGTVNDLAKMVAFERGCPQVVFATAPSMNGYTSLSASTTTDGIKRSYRTRTPVGVYFDLRVLAAAPARLIRAGLGDSVCRSTAQSDWLLSHLVLGRPYREAPFAMLAADEHALFGHTAELLGGDLAAMRHLVRTLVLSGFGMTICNGSYPASQGEHLLSHYMEMMRPAGVSLGFHGEQIGVCASAMMRLQDAWLARDTPPIVRPSVLTREQLIAHYGPVIGDGCWREYEHKRLDAAQVDAINAHLARSWDAIRTRITRVRMDVRKMLVDAGACVEPEQLAWPAELFGGAWRHAREIRNRYTFLDLEADAR